MVHYTKILNGLAAYIDHELAAQFAGSLKGWTIGAVGGIIAARAGQLIAVLKDNPLLTSMGIVDGEMIDIELLYGQFSAAASKGNATANIPLLGPVTFSARDIDALHRYIIGG